MLTNAFVLDSNSSTAWLHYDSWGLFPDWTTATRLANYFKYNSRRFSVTVTFFSSSHFPRSTTVNMCPVSVNYAQSWKFANQFNRYCRYDQLWLDLSLQLNRASLVEKSLLIDCFTVNLKRDYQNCNVCIEFLRKYQSWRHYWFFAWFFFEFSLNFRWIFADMINFDSIYYFNWIQHHLSKNRHW